MIKSSGFFKFLKNNIPQTIWAIGISSMLINMSTSVVFSGSALYLKLVLGVGVATIGVLEALVEAVAYGIRIFSGVISDYFRRRKFLIIVGFSLIALSKPLLALSKTYAGIFCSRTIDRIGNGIQATPRDALVSDAAPKEHKGASYGLRQSLAVVGSTLGGLFGIAIMKMSNNNFELLFTLASIPAVFAVMIVILFVKEKLQNKSETKAERRRIKLIDLILLGKKYWILMGVVVVFMLSRFSEVFISLHACGNFGLNVAYGTAITMVYNLLSAIVSYPMGKLSDKIERTKILLFGFIVLLAAHLSMGYATSLPVVFLGTVFWGIQRGITEGILATLVSDYAPKELRGTAFGVYYLIVSVSTAVASIIAGSVSEKSGEGSAFVLGAGFCSIAIIMLFLLRNMLSKKD